jgi:molybdopterin molybdotransferase
MQPLIPLDEARARLLDQLAVTAAVESVALDEANGRILAQDVVASMNVPPKANSEMDGYALCEQDAIEGRVLTVSQRIPAGAVTQPHVEGSVARIFTGAELPDGANLVVMQENTVRLESGEVRILQTAKAGENVRQAGLDIKQGEVVLKRGTRLTPAALGVCASIGVERVDLYKPLRVALLSTGDELVEPGTTLRAGQIYNSNRPMLLNLLRQAGFEPIDLGLVADNPQATLAALERAHAEADAILTMGGVSVGEEDHVKSAIQTLGWLAPV